MNNQRTILHVDLNSFFATATQQANPVLRGKPVGIVKATGRTCIIAASVEAKKYGVSTGCRVAEAKALCPSIILVPADFEKYEDISMRFIKICRDFSPICEVFSLDECFIDVSESQKFWQKAPANLNLNQLAWLEMLKSINAENINGAVNIAFEIKAKLREEIGEHMSCSAGISHSRLLAKLASSQIKPDGLFWINEQNALEVLDRSELMDICGLGFGLYKRLVDLGINNFAALRECSLTFLHDHFGPFWSVHLFNICRGIDNTPVLPYFNIEEAKSVGRTYTTHRLLTKKGEIYQLIRNLCEEAAAKARKMNLAGRYVGLSIRSGYKFGGNSSSGWTSQRSFGDGYYGHKTLKNYIDDGKGMFDLCMNIVKDWEIKNVIYCGVTLAMLTNKDYLSVSLFAEDRKHDDLIKSADEINEKYGDYTVFPGQLLGTSIIRPEVTGYFGDKSYRLRYALRD